MLHLQKTFGQETFSLRSPDVCWTTDITTVFLNMDRNVTHASRGLGGCRRVLSQGIWSGGNNTYLSWEPKLLRMVSRHVLQENCLDIIRKESKGTAQSGLRLFFAGVAILASPDGTTNKTCCRIGSTWVMTCDLMPEWKAMAVRLHWVGIFRVVWWLAALIQARLHSKHTIVYQQWGQGWKGCCWCTSSFRKLSSHWTCWGLCQKNIWPTFGAKCPSCVRMQTILQKPISECYNCNSRCFHDLDSVKYCRKVLFFLVI